jgi:hypothetical protein
MIFLMKKILDANVESPYSLCGTLDGLLQSS